MLVLVEVRAHALAVQADPAREDRGEKDRRRDRDNDVSRAVAEEGVVRDKAEPVAVDRVPVDDRFAGTEGAQTQLPGAIVPRRVRQDLDDAGVFVVPLAAEIPHLERIFPPRRAQHGEAQDQKTEPQQEHMGSFHGASFPICNHADSIPQNE